MHFDHIDYSNKYIQEILYIIRLGIQKRNKLCRNKREVLNTQSLVDTFNMIGVTMCETLIGAQKEHEREDGRGKEDIYFYLNDDSYTRIFFAEAKRLPKYKTESEAEYVVGKSSTNNPSGGIERYKLGIHGNKNLRNNGMLAYIENKSVKEWLQIVNNKITKEFPQDSPLILTDNTNEYTSVHTYVNHEGVFTMYHFWIDLSLTR